MGHTGSVSRLVGAFGKEKANHVKLRELEKMLKCDDPKYGGILKSNGTGHARIHRKQNGREAKCYLAGTQKSSD